MSLSIPHLLRIIVSAAGEFSLFMVETFGTLKHFWRRRGLFVQQCEFIGVSSLGVILVAAGFIGSVLGYQLYVSFHLFHAEALLGGSVGVALLRELAPVMTAVMMTGRSGAAMTAEIASMRINEQIDALEVMAVNPIEYLVVPRVTAGFLMAPLLSVVFGAVASFAAAGVACGLMGLDPTIFWTQYARMVDRIDVVHCVVKGAFFGLMICWVGCYYGFRAQGGARAVGFATRTSVVASVLAVLFTDYVLTSFLPFGFYYLVVS